LYAEFDNFRKRTMRERVDLIRNASRESLEKMLPILDDFARAETASKDAEDASAH
jgi:molecular chaperone GrpE